jgi:hypothetical protein
MTAAFVKSSITAAALAVSCVVSGGGASAAPISNPLALRDAVPAQVDQVQWRGRGGGHWHHGGYWRGGGWRGPGPIIGGLAAGALIGSSLAYGAYPPAYYAPGPVQVYPDNYVDDYDYGSYAGNDDATAYCVQRFRSYDPASGTYLGYDGQRHPCP